MTYEAEVAKQVALQFECKLDALRKNQDGTVKLTLTINPTDFPMQLMSDPMGQRYVSVMVAVNDDETPKIGSGVVPTNRAAQGVEQLPPAPINDIVKYAPSQTIERKPSQRAYLKAQNAVFWDFIQVETYDEADAFIKQRCGIESKSELDTNNEALAAYERLEKDFDAHVIELQERQRGR